MIIDFHQYIMGNRFTEAEAVNPIRCDEDILSKFIKEVNMSYTASNNIKATDSANRFFILEPDIAKFTTKEHRQEVFYAYKSGMYSSIIPSKFLFMLNKCKKEYLSLNMFTRVIPSKDRELLFTKGCISDDYNLYDIIKSLFDKEFQPLGESCLSVKRSAYTEIYIYEKDTVALIPSKIGDTLSDSDIKRLTVIGKDICIGDIPIKTLSGYYGVCNSTYDLRDNV